jgi:ABC-type Na+ transport system ATPase subunit NatA
MIEAHGLVKRYGSTMAVDDLSFFIRPGLVTGFLGPNGAGKPVTELRHSLLARQADCRSPGQRSSSRTRPPS